MSNRAHQPVTAPDVIDCTGVSIGNSDIESSSTQGDVRPEDVRPGSTPLPIYPQPGDLPPDPVARRIQSQMYADGLLPDRRLGRGEWIPRATEAALLSLAGFGYLVALVAGVSLAADFMGVL